MEPPVPAPCRPRARARVFRAGQGPLTSHACGHSLWPWSSSPAPEGRLERMPCSRVHDSLRIVFQRRGLALGSSGKLQCVRTFASTIGALCELPKDLGGFPSGSDGKERACSAGDLHPTLVSGRSPGGGRDNPLQHSCWRILMARGAWRAVVMGSQSQP